MSSHTVPVTAPRRFPFSPRTTGDLEIGDLIAIALDAGGWGCLQVTDLKRGGAGSLKNLVVGVLEWHGVEEPTPASVLGSEVREQGLTRIELYTEGGYQVTGSCAVSPNPWPSNFRDFEVGTVHKVWGWKTAARKLRSA